MLIIVPYPAATLALDREERSGVRLHKHILSLSFNDMSSIDIEFQENLITVGTL